MVGNDVVDLLDPDTDPCHSRERFDARVCRPAERFSIERSEEPSRERWCHWAAKEASYKLLRKRVPKTVFLPLRFEVEFIADSIADCGSRSGRVMHAEHVIDIAISCRDDAVHAVATWPGPSGGGVVVEQLRLGMVDSEPLDPAGQSRAVRRLVIQRLGECLALQPERLSISKREQIPELLIDGALCGADLSLSHHGHVVAFACRLPARSRLERLAS